MRAKTLVPLLAAFVFTGCCSYKFEGFLDNKLAAQTCPKLARQYVIKEVNAKIIGNDYYHIGFADKELSAADLIRAKPEVFLNREAAQNGESAVSISVFSESEEYSKTWTILVPYAVTLCVFPAWLDCEDVYTVKVVMERDGKKQTVKTPMRLTTNSKFTGYSPIGLIPYDTDQDAEASRADEEFGLMQTLSERAKNYRRMVFVETLANAVEICLRQMEGAR